MALTLTKVIQTEESFTVGENLEKLIIYTKSEIVAIINRQQVAIVPHPSKENLIKNKIKNNLLSFGWYYFPEKELEEIEEKLDEIADFFANADSGEKTIGEGEVKSSLMILVKD
jgi:hypothetical protein